MLGCVLEVATYVLDVSAELGLVHGRRYRLRKQRTQVHRDLNDVAHDQPAIVAQGAAVCSGWSETRHRDRCPSCPSSSTTTETRCARWRLLHWPHRPLQQMRERGRASPANVKSGWPGPIPKCHTCIGPPQRPRPARTCARTIARTTARTHAHARPQTWPGAFAQMSARFHPRYACMRAWDGGESELCAPQVR